MIKIIQNTTGSAIFVADVGTNIAANSSYTIPPTSYPSWAASNNAIPFIANGSFVVNDGTVDLGIADAVALIQGNFKQSDFIPALKTVTSSSDQRLKIDMVFSGDQLLKVSSNDQTSGYLQAKTSGTAGRLVLSVPNDGGAEVLVFDVGANIFDKTIDSSLNISHLPAGNISSTNVRAAINELDVEKQAISEKGQANGYAPLDGTAKIAAIYLPSYVDDVVEYANLAAFPGTGETGKIYVALDTNKTYRWSGSTYTEVSPSDVNSVFGRMGVVTAQNGDYNAGQITNTPAGNITAITAQLALNQLDTIKQPLDAGLSALAAYNTNGFLVQTANDTFVGRSFAAGTGLTLTNPAGAAGNPSYSITNTAVTAGAYGSATAIATFTVNAQGQLTLAGSTSISIPSTQVNDFVEAAQDAIGAALTNSSNIAFTYNDAANQISSDLINTAVTAGAYGSASQVTSFTVDTKGRLTAAAATNITITTSQVTGLDTALNNKQPLDATLTSLAAYNTNGIVVQTAADTFAGRSIAAGTGISVANGDGVAGNPTVSLANTAVTAGSYGSASQVPTIIFNAQGQATSVTNTAIAIATSQVTGLDTALANKQPLDADLTSIAALTGTGFATQTAVGTWAQRGFDAGTGLSITNPLGISGNPSYSISNTAVTPGSYGSGNLIPVLTINAQGQITNATTTVFAPTTFEVTSATAATTTSSTDALLTGMTITPGAGTYLVLFSSSATSNSAGAAISYSLYTNNTQVAVTLNKISPLDGGLGSNADARGAMAINKIVTVAAAQAIEIRWSISNGTGTAGPRVLNLIKIG